MDKATVVITIEHEDGDSNRRTCEDDDACTVGVQLESALQHVLPRPNLVIAFACAEITTSCLTDKIDAAESELRKAANNLIAAWDEFDAKLKAGQN